MSGWSRLPGTPARYLLGPGPAGGAAAPLLLLPGIEGDARVWSEVPGLGEDRRAEAWDLPVGAAVEDLAAAVLDACPWPVLYVLGASLGGLVGWAMAAQAPGRVRGLVALGTLPDPARCPPLVRAAPPLLRGAPAGLAARLYRARIRARHAEEGVPAELGAALRGALPAPSLLARRLRAVARFRPAGPPPVPTLWLRGQVDREAPWTLADAARALPGATVLTVPGGHRAMLTHPGALERLVAHHLRGLDRAG